MLSKIQRMVRRLGEKDRRNRSAALQVPTFESLESRMLLSVTVQFADNVLTINGDDAKNVIDVTPAATDPAAGKVTVVVRGGFDIVGDEPDAGTVNDRTFEGVQRIVINAGGGNDQVTVHDDVQLVGAVGSGIEINGGAGNDRIVVGENIVTVTDAGDDPDVVAAADVLINGGEGNDRVSVLNQGTNVLNGGEGNDRLTVAANGNNTLNGGEDNDRLTVIGNGDNVLNGGAGNDRLTVVGNGRNVLSGGDGNDRLTVEGNGTNTLNGEVGNDRLTVEGNGSNELNGGDNNDRLRVKGNGNNVLSGGDGNDNIRGGDGNDEIDGGAGNDNIRGGDGDDEIFGGEGNDNIRGGAGNDFIDGGAGRDNIRGDAGNDTLLGGEDGTDRDRISAGRGDDLVDGVFAEVEPNNNPEDVTAEGRRAFPLEVGESLTVTGTVGKRDLEDHFAITLEETGRLQVDIEGLNGRVVTVAIIRADGTLVEDGATATFAADATAAARVTTGNLAPGNYFLRITTTTGGPRARYEATATVLAPVVD